MNPINPVPRNRPPREVKFRRACGGAFASMLLMCGISSLRAGAPNVVSTQPRNGDQDVSATVAEVVVTFDQDMSRSGYSFVGGGATFPKAAGKPFWRTARECVLPVSLAAGQVHRIGINDATHTNFKGATGVPATPFVLTFRTAAPGGAVAGDAHSRSVQQLRDAIERRYSYRDVRVVDWAAAWTKFEPRLKAAKSAREFAVIAGEMLSATKDPHIWLIEGGQIVPAFRREVTPNGNARLLPRLIAGLAQMHPMVATGRAAPGIGYIAIHSWERKHAPQLPDAVFSALEAHQKLPGLVIDVRFNSGGDETMAREFAGCFIRARSVYARHVTLDSASPTGFSAPSDRVIEPAPNRPAYAGRVAVLMGPYDMSSAEGFLLMMRQAPNCKLIGDRSHGASGNPQPHVLANGVTVNLPSWKAMLADGTPFEISGIEPDIKVVAPADDFTRRDPVLERAIEWLKQ